MDFIVQTASEPDQTGLMLTELTARENHKKIMASLALVMPGIHVRAQITDVGFIGPVFIDHVIP